MDTVLDGIPPLKTVDFCKFNFSKQLTLFIFHLVELCILWIIHGSFISFKLDIFQCNLIMYSVCANGSHRLFFKLC